MTQDPVETTRPEPLRSYKLRTAGRMGPARRGAMENLLDRFTVPDGEGVLDLRTLFGRTIPVVLEIGFGMGTSTLEMAEADPATGVLAADVHTPGVAALLLGVDRAGIDSVRVLHGDGRELLQHRIAPGSLAGVRVFFPDPWPKPRHHKRRLVDAAFVGLVADRLAPGGTLHCATDWEPYARQMAEVMAAEPRLALEGDGPHPRPDWRPLTPYENRGLARGHVVTDLLARRVDPSA
ncbi:tRNA (guanosine(46)-N7)-methyltransferase TrmB [Kineococcus gynurae]|uniref:tRNA (guanine-N(7)-)-methyltransferase n=1 Tax=Kineococcus gynurae TaxID=452979 RepID=A0ABV5LT84_9ACTN